MNDAILRNMTNEEILSYVNTLSLTTSLTEELAKRLEASLTLVTRYEGQVYDLEEGLEDHG